MCKYPSKINLGLFPTPLQKLNHLSEITNCGIYMKRDDLCGIAFGGNKVRKLEYILFDAKAKNCDCIITAGGSTSNQTVATACCCASQGMEAHIIIPETTNDKTLTLLKYAGAKIYTVSGSDKLKSEMRMLSIQLKKEGRNPYIIPIGATTDLGVIGYADAVQEIAQQASEQGLKIDHIVCAGGSGNTYSGVLLGTKLYMPDVKTTVISISKRFAHKETLIRNACNGAKLLETCVDISEDDVNIYFCSGKGAADISPKSKKAVALLVQTEGIFPDPIYTGKGIAGLLELCKNGYFDKGENIVFIHTGGLVSLINSL